MILFMIELSISSNNINDFINCNPLEITCLKIYLPKNIELVLNNLHKFINLQKLYLSFNQIKKVKGLDNLVNLQKLDLSYNKITEIKGLDNLVNLQQLNLNNNQITEIKGLDNLVNLLTLDLDYNQIKEIKGRNNLINLQQLYLSYNNITEIKGLDKLVNLLTLTLTKNQITEIKGLNNLVNLQELYLDNNKIIEIKGLDNLINLQTLYLYNNQLTEIKGLDNLVNLEILYLHNNQITEIKGLDNLVNPLALWLGNNHIKELPLNLCNFRNITYFNYSNNPIEYIPLPVQRWLDRNRNRNKNNNIYDDKQNIHNHNIQTSFRNSLTNLLKDKPSINLETVKNEIISNDIITEQTKREILNYCDDKIEHFTYLITYSDLLIYVWSRIRNKDEILKVLNQEITDGLCMCFTGRMTRLLNVLVGFYDDIELQISDSEQITNIIMNLKNNISDNKQLKDAVKKELLDRQYSEAIINEWLEYI